MVNYQEVDGYFIANSPQDLSSLAPQIIQMGNDHKIWLLEGPMGAGKTTLIQALCAAKGVTDVVSSPTYALVNEYRNHKNETFYHFDFYRLKDEFEAMDIGCDEYFESGNICFIEWSNRIPSLIPKRHIAVKIQVEAHDRRKIVIQGNE